jgi:hypothetical protein
MSRVFWDTHLFIYLFEDYGPLSKATAALRTKMLARGDQLLTSALTLGEILVKPTEQGDMQLSSCNNPRTPLIASTYSLCRPMFSRGKISAPKGAPAAYSAGSPILDFRAQGLVPWIEGPWFCT